MCQAAMLSKPAASSGGARLAMLCGGVVAAGVAHALLQEQMLYAMPAKMPLVVTAYEFGVCSSLSGAYLLLAGGGGARAPLWPLARISALVFASLVSGNVALRWVSFPVKVIVKSCKLLPTMALGSLLLHKSYTVWDHAAALLLCCGLVGFTLASHGSAAREPSGGEEEQQTSWVGLALLMLAVCCDAVQVLLQERMMRSHPLLTPMHVMLFTNGIAFAAVVAAIAFTGEVDAVPVGLPWGRLLLYGASSWIGVCCFLALTRSHGGTAAVVATNSRKLVSICLSFVVFPKPVSGMMLLSGASVVSGVAIHATRKATMPTPMPKRRAE
mmetsp:Transcript_34918/g.115732  ORF Transcript_34918/g.115732 Transcript_34918/m.115732 type:complete len:327 (-) Transcript_34918:213-1193(-)